MYDGNYDETPHDNLWRPERAVPVGRLSFPDQSWPAPGSSGECGPAAVASRRLSLACSRGWTASAGPLEPDPTIHSIPSWIPPTAGSCTYLVEWKTAGKIQTGLSGGANSARWGC